MAERKAASWKQVMAIVVAHATGVVLLLATIRGCANQAERARDADRMEKVELRNKCRDARVLFFDSCGGAGYARWYCETQWSNLHDRVWDTDPSKPWAEQIDCSEKKE